MISLHGNQKKSTHSKTSSGTSTSWTRALHFFISLIFPSSSLWNKTKKFKLIGRGYVTGRRNLCIIINSDLLFGKITHDQLALFKVTDEIPMLTVTEGDEHSYLSIHLSQVFAFISSDHGFVLIHPEIIHGTLEDRSLTFSD